MCLNIQSIYYYGLVKRKKKKWETFPQFGKILCKGYFAVGNKNKTKREKVLDQWFDSSSSKDLDQQQIQYAYFFVIRHLIPPFVRKEMNSLVHCIFGIYTDTHIIITT